MYPLPKFVSKTVAAQASAPRDVSLLSVAAAVLGGLDCVIYVVSGVFLLAIGGQVLSTVPSAPGWIAAALFGAGAALILLVTYRIWSVRRVLQTGDARLAEVVQAETGVVRLWGTPWGDLMGSKYSAPPAARGTYRLVDTGETGRYYMQQRWALPLFPGDTIWVLRYEGHDALYAPAAARPAGEQGLPEESKPA